MSVPRGLLKLLTSRQAAMRRSRGVRLECTEGLVWLTVEGRSDDHFLAQGEQLRIDSGGLVLVEGEPAGAIRLHGAAPWPVRRALALLRFFDRFALPLRLVRVVSAVKLG